MKIHIRLPNGSGLYLKIEPMPPGKFYALCGVIAWAVFAGFLAHVLS